MNLMNLISRWGLLLLLPLALAGCAMQASSVLPSLDPGTDKQVVLAQLGQPDATFYVHFKGHADEYEVWQYPMVPDTPLCPSEGVGRTVTGMFTLGLSEIAWSHAMAVPHWIYFYEDRLVYTSRAFDCMEGEFCNLRPVKLSSLR